MKTPSTAKKFYVEFGFAFMFVELILVLLVSYKLNWNKKQRHYKMRQEEKKKNEDASKLQGKRASLNRNQSEHSENVSEILFRKKYLADLTDLDGESKQARKFNCIHNGLG